MVPVADELAPPREPSAGVWWPPRSKSVSPSARLCAIPPSGLACTYPRRGGECDDGLCEAPQPFTLRVHPDAAFLCDLHAHLCDAEIITPKSASWRRSAAERWSREFEPRGMPCTRALQPSAREVTA